MKTKVKLNIKMRGC